MRRLASGEISLLSRALDIKMSDMAPSLSFPMQKKDFIDMIANVDTYGIRAHEAKINGI